MNPEHATEQLHKAIVDHAAAHGLTDGDELLSEWAVVSNWQPVVSEGGMSRYLTQLPLADSTPFHVAVGLLEVGLQVLRECAFTEEDDE